MKFKRILAAGMVAAMALSTAAFASETTTITPNEKTGAATGTVQMTGQLNIPAISVTIPSAGAVLLNPYRLEVKASAEEDAAVIGSDGVMSPAYELSSKTTVALDVGVIASVKAAGDVKIVNAPLAALAEGTKAKNKEVFTYLAFLEGGDADSTADSFVDYRESKDDAEALRAALVLTEKAASAPVIMGKIDAATDESTPSTSAFMIKGEAYAMTTEPWVSADKVSATLIFSFTPNVDESAAPYAPAGN